MSKDLAKKNVTRVAIITAAPESLISFMGGHIDNLAREYSTYAVCNGIHNIPVEKLNPKISYIDISIQRKFSPLKDLISLFQLILFINKNKFLLVHSITPKAGLLTMISAWCCRVPVRVHTFTGQVWVTKRGIFRRILILADKIIAFLATNILVDSESQKKYLIANGVVTKNKANVLCDGSICGVNLQKFRPNIEIKNKIRTDFKIPKDAIVGIFLGRFKKDKGVLDLANAIGELNPAVDNFYFLFVGKDEESLRDEIIKLVAFRSNKVYVLGQTDNPQDYLAAADFLCLPSYREGFGLVTIEAASVGLPTLASKIYGITDAIIDGVTGILHKPGDSSEIAKGLHSLVLNANLRLRLGAAARDRAINKFSNLIIEKAKINYYKQLISELNKNA